MSTTLASLRVSENRRFLVQEDGAPFFWLGDTAWELFHRLTREEIDRYLRHRAAQGYTVIQAVMLGIFPSVTAPSQHPSPSGDSGVGDSARHARVLAGAAGVDTPNAYGDLPLLDKDPTRPNEVYFEHVDWALERAAQIGLYVALAPAWGTYVIAGGRSELDAIIFTPQNALTYGAWVGARYRRRTNVIWMIGGDRDPVPSAPSGEQDVRPVWRALARGVRECSAKDAGGVPQLMTFHPPGGGRSSSEWFHAADWLDFNMMQTGPRRRNHPNYETISRDYALTPTKPTMDAEPGYEQAFAKRPPTDERYTDYDVRKFAYWALFAGAHGHTYGCLEIWQFYDAGVPQRAPANGAELQWLTALDLPGARQMQHARRLLESRPFLSRAPDQSLLLSDAMTGTDHIRATRAADGSYALIYSAAGHPFTVDLHRLSGSTARAWWFDPREGTASLSGELPTTAPREFVPPSHGPGQDWVLVLDDAARAFPSPGAANGTAKPAHDPGAARSTEDKKGKQP